MDLSEKSCCSMAYVFFTVYRYKTRSQAVARIASQHLWGSCDVIGHVTIWCSMSYWWSFGTKSLSLTVSEISNVKCNAIVDVTFIRPLNKGRGHWFWHQSISHIRLPIGCQVNSNFCSRTHRLATIHHVTDDGRNTVSIARRSAKNWQNIILMCRYRWSRKWCNDGQVHDTRHCNSLWSSGVHYQRWQAIVVCEWCCRRCLWIRLVGVTIGPSNPFRIESNRHNVRQEDYFVFDINPLTPTSGVNPGGVLGSGPHQLFPCPGPHIGGPRLNFHK